MRQEIKYSSSITLGLQHKEQHKNMKSEAVYLILYLSVVALIGLYQARNGIATVKSTPLSGVNYVLHVVRADIDAVEEKNAEDGLLAAVNDGHGGTNGGIDIASDNDAAKAEPESVAKLSGTADTSEEVGAEVKPTNEPTTSIH